MKRQVNAPAKFVDRWSGHVLGRAIGGLFRALGWFGKLRLDGPPQRILLVKFCCMGDAVLMLPALRALRGTFPEARITMLCTPRTVAIFRECPQIDEVVLFPLTGARGLPEFVSSAVRALFGTVAAMRARRYDVVIDFDNYYNWTTFLGFATGAPVRVGFDPPGQGRRFLLTHPVRHDGQRHMVEFYLDLARAIGADTDDKSIQITIPAEAEGWAEEFLTNRGLDGDGRPLVVLSPGRSEAWHFIRWAEEHFASVAERLHRRLDAHILLMGGKAEGPITARISARLAARGITAIDTVGATTIQQSEAVMKHADLLICNDSGPMHLGAAVGVPTLAVFGPANPVRWGPYGPQHRVVRRDLDCSPCLFMGKLGRCPRRLLECLDVPVDDVFATAVEMLESRRLERTGAGRS